MVLNFFEKHTGLNEFDQGYCCIGVPNKVATRGKRLKGVVHGLTVFDHSIVTQLQLPNQ